MLKYPDRLGGYFSRVVVQGVVADRQGIGHVPSRDLVSTRPLLALALVRAAMMLPNEYGPVV